MSCLNCLKGKPVEAELKAELIHQTHPRTGAIGKVKGLGIITTYRAVKPECRRYSCRDQPDQPEYKPGPILI
jgi:hypothetical protein